MSRPKMEPRTAADRARQIANRRYFVRRQMPAHVREEFERRHRAESERLADAQLAELDAWYAENVKRVQHANKLKKLRALADELGVQVEVVGHAGPDGASEVRTGATSCVSSFVCAGCRKRLEARAGQSIAERRTEHYRDSPTCQLIAARKSR